MYAKSFIALGGNGRLTGARTAQTASYDRHSCHLCHSEVHYHSAYDTQRPWFEHTPDVLPEHCPCVNPDTGEQRLVARLQRSLLDAAPTVSKAS